MASPNDLVNEIYQSLIDGSRSVLDLSEEEIVGMRNRINPYGQSIDLSSGHSGVYAYSLTNLSEEYYKKYYTTGILGFLYRRVDEYGVPDGDYVTPSEDIDEEEATIAFIEENLVNGKIVLKKEKKAGVSGGEDYSPEETSINRFKRMIIYQFLKDTFEFNPDKHVRSAYQRNKDDAERKKIDINKRHLKKYKKGEQVSKSESKRREYNRMIDHVPPADMFHFLTYYMEANHDAIRIATKNLYNEKPDLDYVLKIYDHFPNMDEYNKFVHKHENEVTAQIRCCEQNKWVFQTSTIINRERQQYYNRHNRVLKDILESVEANQRLGRDIMHKRIKRKKDQNIEECGPDDEKFLKEYKKEQKKYHHKAGLREQSEVDRQRRDLEDKYMNKYDRPSKLLDDEEFKNAIQVQVWTHDTKNKTMKPDFFFTEAEDIEPEKTAISSVKQ